MQFNFWKSGRKNSSPGGSVEWSLGLPMFIIPNAPSLPPLACLTGQDTPSRATFTQMSSSLLLPMCLKIVYYVLHFWRRAGQGSILGRKPSSLLSLPPNPAIIVPAPTSTPSQHLNYQAQPTPYLQILNWLWGCISRGSQSKSEKGINSYLKLGPRSLPNSSATLFCQNLLYIKVRRKCALKFKYPRSWSMNPFIAPHYSLCWARIWLSSSLSSEGLIRQPDSHAVLRYKHERIFKDTICKIMFA